MALMETCLTPVLLAGALFTLHPNNSHTADRDGVFIEAQTCRVGLGAHVLGSSTEFYAGGIQYGIPFALSNSVAVTLQPFFGGSYTARPERQLPMGAQFWTGVNVVVSYDRWIVGAKWGHASNAGLKSPNVGMDWVGVFAGVSW